MRGANLFTKVLYKVWLIQPGFTLTLWSERILDKQIKLIIPEAAAVENDEKNAEYENNEDYPHSSPKV